MIIENGKRALVYTSPVLWIKPIEGADNIELIGILGWTLIAKKGEFSEGDMAIYFEIDSKLPEADWSEFMATKGYKVKTMKLSKFGVISQGLALPIDAFPAEIQNKIPTEENVDLTDLLGVTYIEAEDNARKATDNTEVAIKAIKGKHKKFFSNPIIKRLMHFKWFRTFALKVFGLKKTKNAKAFPTGFPYVHKTDEERIQNLPYLLGYPNPLIVTEKVDGTSCTYILERKKHNKFEFYVTSRNVRQLTPDQECYHEDNIYWELAFKYKIEEHLKEYLEQYPELDYVCIQGEGVGNVQGNPLKLKENLLMVFNFIRSDVGRLPSTEGDKIVHDWGMTWVPILDENFMMPCSMEEILNYATAKSAVNPSVLREGVVLRDPTTDLSFKAVSTEYLLKHNI